MPSLTNYRGLQVLDPDPSGAGGLAIQDDLKSLVTWGPKSLLNQSTSPTVDDDVDADFYPGSLWLQTNTTPPRLFVCKSNAAGAAEWITLVQTDNSPKLGGDLDVNGHKLTGTVTIGTTGSDTLTLNAGEVTVPSGVVFTKTAQTGVAENICAWKVSDDANSSLSLVNGTSNAGSFAPKFQGVQAGTNVALNFNGQSTSGNDSGTNPYVLFAFQNGSSDVATRPGVEFRNRATSLWQILGNGTVKRLNGSTRDSNQVVAFVATTDATQTTAAEFAITAGCTYLIEARIVARRTGGSAGTADDGASYVRRGTYTTKSGTVTLMGSVQTIGTDAEDQAGWDVTLDISGASVRVRVTGAANNNVTWFVDATVQRVAS